jgi:hypothetical protein
MISTLGVDLAASPDRTWACTLEETEDGAICATLHARCDDDDLLEIPASTASSDTDASPRRSSAITSSTRSGCPIARSR